jgi:hypothetical protein
MVDEGNGGAREGTGGAVVETTESLLCFANLFNNERVILCECFFFL